MYDGGSYKDELIISENGNSVQSPVTTLGNQIIIIFTTDGNGVSKGFTAKITFGIWTKSEFILTITILQQYRGSSRVSET